VFGGGLLELDPDDPRNDSGSLLAASLAYGRFVKSRKVGGAWKVVEARADGSMWLNAVRRLKVIESVGVRSDRRIWHHVSVSAYDVKDGRVLPMSRLPTWDEMSLVRDALIGADREAYIIYPPRSRYVNIAQVLHLWHCLSAPDGAVLPPMEGRLAGGSLTI
jgi:hypothetical protein